MSERKNNSGNGHRDYTNYSEDRKRWEEQTYKPKGKYRKDGITFTTVSSQEVPHIVGPEYYEQTGWDPKEKLEWPGEYPYTRGVHPTMYRGKLWTMRQFAGFGTPEGSDRTFRSVRSSDPDGS